MCLLRNTKSRFSNFHITAVVVVVVVVVVVAVVLLLYDNVRRNYYIMPGFPQE